MTVEDWYAAVRPKVQASWNLHEALPKDLDFFILLSSGSGMVGNRGQANYCAGNSYQDALARYRVLNGLKATSLGLGTILSVGFIAENTDTDLTTNRRGQGFNSMREEEYHAMLDELCNPHLERPSLLKARISLGFQIPENLRSKGVEEPEWMSDPLFRHLYQIRVLASGGDSGGESVNYSGLLAGVESHDAAAEIIFDAIVKKLCKLLNTEPRDIDPSKALPAFGIDSLMAIELRSWLLKEMGAEVAVFEMLEGSSVRAFAALVATRSSFVKSTETEE
jgi:aryl carrier-like protein